MILYISTIVIGMILIAVFNIIFNTYDLSLWYIIISVVVLTVAVIAVGGLFAFIIRHLCPRRWFAHGKKCYEVGRKEINFYKAVGIKHWKDKVPELGGFTGFHKNIHSPVLDSKYFERFLYEVNCGIVVHIACMIVGYAIVFILPLKYWYMFALPVATVNLVLHYLPICILRYNNPRLTVAYKSMLRKEQRAQQADSVLVAGTDVQ